MVHTKYFIEQMMGKRVQVILKNKDHIRGLNDSWELIMKLFRMSDEERTDIFGIATVQDIVDAYTPECVAEKIKQAENGIIEPGSEFDNGVVGYVTSKIPQSNYYNVVFSDGSVDAKSDAYLKDHLTGNVNRALVAVLNMNKDK